MLTDSRGGIAGLQAHLEAAANAASRSIGSADPERAAFVSVLGQFAADIAAAEVALPAGASAQITKVIEQYQVRYNALRSMMDAVISRTTQDLSSAFADLERDAHLVTIMLFGRTRAGKSTTMEALTRGDGATIGTGRQHTTKDIRAYHVPRTHSGEPLPGPGLRIVDTPGIEGFEGDALAEMAEKFVERCDHILFLLTDDKATADELDRFGLIRTQGKGVTVLLNVKAADEDLDVLVSNPDLIFREEELAGHSRRICNYLEQHYNVPPPRLIPLHARAGWLGGGGGELPDGVEDRDALLLRSRLADVETRIIEFIREQAVPARLAAPRDLVLGYLWPLKGHVRPFARDFRQLMDNVGEIVHRIERGAERARVQVSRRFPLLRARFQAVSDALPGMVDSVIAAGGRGAALDLGWKQLLTKHGVTEAAEWFLSMGRQDFAAEIAEEVRVAAFDHQFADARDAGDLLDDYQDADASSSRSRYARAAIRTAGGTAAAGLAAWAVANFWNPSGWVAAGAAVLVAGAGMAGEAVARKVTESLERSSRQELYEKRGLIETRLRTSLWSDYDVVRAHCGTWLDDTKAHHLRIARDIAKPIQVSARLLWRSSVECLRGMDEIADRINASLVADLFGATIPECADGKIQVNRVVRASGWRTKVMVSCNDTARTSAIGACVGRNGTRIKRIRAALGNEQVDLVDGQAAAELQVLQALGLATTSGVTVVVTHAPGGKAARVLVDEKTSELAGPRLRSSNVRLAASLLGVDIFVETGKK